MKENELVSVVIPFYNAEKYIRQSVDSILNQSYRNLEIILIDDCSQDSSSKIIQSIKDSRIRLIRNDTNLNIAKSLNKGFLEAKGQYIARLDADDFSDKERIRKQYEVFCKYENVGLVCTSSHIINEKSKIIGEFTPAFNSEELYYILFLSNRITHSSIMCKKSVWSEEGKYEEDSFLEDQKLWFKISKRHKIFHINEKLTYWRTHTENSQKVNKDTYKFLAFTFAKKNLEELIGYGIEDYIIENLIDSSEILKLNKEQVINFKKVFEDMTDRLIEEKPSFLNLQKLKNYISIEKSKYHFVFNKYGIEEADFKFSLMEYCKGAVLYLNYIKHYPFFWRISPSNHF